jgi:hypothetical protein
MPGFLEIVRKTKIEIDGSETIKIAVLHRMWNTLEHHVDVINSRITHLSSQYPDIAKQFGLYLAQDPDPK